MSDKLTTAEFIAKVDWEGGPLEAIEYGLTVDDLVPSSHLVPIWEQLVAAYRDHLEPALAEWWDTVEAYGDTA